MSESRSSQRRRIVATPDSSVTKVRFELAAIAAAAQSADDQRTVISSYTPGSESSPSAPLLPALEVGKLLEGERLGQFELRKFVGGGGMGVVFRAWDTTLNREVAVKVLSRDQSADDETLRRFRNEAQSAARLDHGNIARVYFVGEDRGVHYIVFEFIEGVNLRDLVDRHGPLPVDEAIEYTLQIAEALDHASQRDVIHRDIKPSNVLITSDGLAKLVDMGLARLHQVEHTNDDLTASGVTLGTFDYISPEQARDPRSADVRSDLYSLGCSLYFMLIGKPPFPQGTVLQKLLQHQGDEAPDPRSLRPELPIEVVKVVRKLLAKSPGQRYQRPVELIDELHRVRERLLSPAGATSTSAWSFPSQANSNRIRKHLPWALPIATLVVVSLGLDFYWSQIDHASALPRSFNTALTQQNPSQSSPRVETPDTVTPADPSRNISTSIASPPKIPEATTATLDLVTNANKQASGGASTDTVTASPSSPIGASNGLLVVGDPASGATYPTLEAAFRVAKSGDIIELRFSGPRSEAPLSIANTKLTIRAGEGYSPIVRFAPVEADPVKSARAMITMLGGSLSLMNVAIEFSVPREIAADWCLFEMHEAESLRLNRSSLTIRNSTEGGAALHANVAFFVVAPSSGADLEPAKASALTPQSLSPPSNFELENCIVRGEASLLRVAAGESARLDWKNGLLATTERMIVTDGTLLSRRPSRIEVDADHLTADVRHGLAWLDFTSIDAGSIVANLRFAGSIIHIGSDSPMIEQIGIDAPHEFEGSFTWNGDRNFYEAVDNFWQQTDSAESDLGQHFSFSDWREFWGQHRETLPYLNAVVWQQFPNSRKPMSHRTPADYALSVSSASNPARDSASDGLNAGCLQNQLPTLPAR